MEIKPTLEFLLQELCFVRWIQFSSSTAQDGKDWNSKNLVNPFKFGQYIS